MITNIRLKICTGMADRLEVCKKFWQRQTYDTKVSMTAIIATDIA